MCCSLYSRYASVPHDRCRSSHRWHPGAGSLPDRGKGEDLPSTRAILVLQQETTRRTVPATTQTGQIQGQMKGSSSRGVITLPMLGAGSSSGFELFQVFMGTGL